MKVGEAAALIMFPLASTAVTVYVPTAPVGRAPSTSPDVEAIEYVAAADLTAIVTSADFVESTDR
jgi:hypothetical protein